MIELATKPKRDGIYWLSVYTRNIYNIDPLTPQKLYNVSNYICQLCQGEVRFLETYKTTPMKFPLEDIENQFKDFVSANWYFLGTYREGPIGLING